VVHEWMGLDDYVKRRADMLAQLGYVAFAADIYGKGVRADSMEEAQRLSGIYKGDRPLMRTRAQAALDILKKQAQVDSAKVATMGYCFGGTVALELARSGADMLGAVSFHGGLNTPNSQDASKIKGKILVLHGGDDSFVPADEVAAFEDEMRSAKVDWQLNSYGNSVHGFTNDRNGSDNSKGVAYNAKADKRSWEAMKTFFNEIFK